MKVGDVVLYSIQGKTYNALVLFAHSNLESHLGDADEPLLHLAFLAPERESPSARSKPGYLPQVFIEYDVVHASHEFSDEYKKDNGLVTPAQIASQRGVGEWSELVSQVDAELASRLEYATEALSKQYERNQELAQQLAHKTATVVSLTSDGPISSPTPPVILPDVPDSDTPAPDSDPEKGN